MWHARIRGKLDVLRQRLSHKGQAGQQLLDDGSWKESSQKLCVLIFWQGCLGGRGDGWIHQSFLARGHGAFNACVIH